MGASIGIFFGIFAIGTILLIGVLFFGGLFVLIATDKKAVGVGMLTSGLLMAGGLGAFVMLRMNAGI